MAVMESASGSVARAAVSSLFHPTPSRLSSRVGSSLCKAAVSHRYQSTGPFQATSSSLLGKSNSNLPLPSYIQRPSLPANTIIRFVPQQTAWIVERMGRFNRILEPGLAILIPFLDRIAYVKSLKENAIEIPSQSAITADNVTLELDGVLYTRVLDAYKARCFNFLTCDEVSIADLTFILATALRMPNMPSLSSHRPPCVQKSAG